MPVLPCRPLDFFFFFSVSFLTASFDAGAAVSVVEAGTATLRSLATIPGSSTVAAGMTGRRGASAAGSSSAEINLRAALCVSASI